MMGVAVLVVLARLLQSGYGLDCTWTREVDQRLQPSSAKSRYRIYGYERTFGLDHCQKQCVGYTGGACSAVNYNSTEGKCELVYGYDASSSENQRITVGISSGWNIYRRPECAGIWYQWRTVADAALTNPHTYSGTNIESSSTDLYGSTSIIQCLTQSQCLSADYNTRDNKYNLNSVAEDGVNVTFTKTGETVGYLYMEKPQWFREGYIGYSRTASDQDMLISATADSRILLLGAGEVQSYGWIYAVEYYIQTGTDKKVTLSLWTKKEAANNTYNPLDITYVVKSSSPGPHFELLDEEAVSVHPGDIFGLDVARTNLGFMQNSVPEYGVMSQHSVGATSDFVFTIVTGVNLFKAYVKEKPSMASVQLSSTLKESAAVRVEWDYELNKETTHFFMNSSFSENITQDKSILVQVPKNTLVSVQVWPCRHVQTTCLEGIPTRTLVVCPALSAPDITVTDVGTNSANISATTEHLGSGCVESMSLLFDDDSGPEQELMFSDEGKVELYGKPGTVYSVLKLRLTGTAAEGSNTVTFLTNLVVNIPSTEAPATTPTIIITTPTSPTGNPESQVNNDGQTPDDSTAAIIGGVVGAILVLVVVVFVIFLMRRRSAKPMKSSTERLDVNYNRSKVAVVAPQVVSVPPRHTYEEVAEFEVNELYGTSGPRRSYLDPIEDDKHGSTYTNIGRRVSTGELKSYVDSSVADGSLKTHFQAMPTSTAEDCLIGKSPENKVKNRFQNIVPYDHKRVILTSEGGGADYVNASYVDGYAKAKQYIAAQGPKEKLLGDFWRMIIQEKVTVIVMLTKEVEMGMHKCEAYWPKEVGQDRTFAATPNSKIKVHLNELSHFPDCTVRVMNVSKMESGDLVTSLDETSAASADPMIARDPTSPSDQTCSAVQRIVQFQFTAWPDHTGPQFPTALLAFYHRVRPLANQSQSPVLVHCSAGVGRTGTFISLDSLKREAEATGQLSIDSCMRRVRSCRAHMVQNVDQYLFLHEALVELMDHPPPIPLHGVSRKLLTGAKAEYERMAPHVKPLSQQDDISPLAIEHKHKNRDQDILPYVMDTLRISSGEYINAYWCNGYREPSSLVITQMPLTNTRVDFWTLVDDTKSQTIIMANPAESADAYWPDEIKTTVSHGVFDITCSDIQLFAGYQMLVLHVQRKKLSSSLKVRLYQIQNWSGLVPENLGQFAECVKSAQLWQSGCSDKPVVIHCMNGAERSGLVAAAYNIATSVAEGTDVDVYTTVKLLRDVRPQQLSHSEQYVFLYKLAINIVEHSSLYENFTPPISSTC